MTTSAPTTAPRSQPVVRPSGPSPSKVLILGEAPGEEEAKLGQPFVGVSGAELKRMLSEAGLDPSACRMTNVLSTRPPNNKLEAFFISALERKSLVSSGCIKEGTPLFELPTIRQGKFLHPAFTEEVSAAITEIRTCAPNVILALGNTALWLTTGQTAISKYRGTVLPCLWSDAKVIPTYHPAAVLRDWSLRVVVLADLLKVKRQAEFKEIRRPRRTIWTNPSLLDLYLWQKQELPHARSLSVDVETRRGQITEIGFAPRPNHALVVPFIRDFNQHYWATSLDERRALDFVSLVLASPAPKVFQNGLYDLQYIWKTWGIAPQNCLLDTMLHHHSLFPELQKGLGFLGSIYTDEPAWKVLRSRKAKDTVKRDDE